MMKWRKKKTEGKLDEKRNLIQHDNAAFFLCVTHYRLSNSLKALSTGFLISPLIAPLRKLSRGCSRVFRMFCIYSSSSSRIKNWPPNQAASPSASHIQKPYQRLLQLRLLSVEDGEFRDRSSDALLVDQRAVVPLAVGPDEAVTERG